MNAFCWWYHTKLAAYDSGELPERLAARIEAHLEQCASCRAELVTQQQFSQALRGATPSGAEPSPFLWERLEAAIHAEAPQPIAPRALPRLAPVGGMALAGAAMAAVVWMRPAPLPVVRPVATPVRVASTPASQPTRLPAVAPKQAVEDALRTAQLEPTPRTADPFVARVSARERPNVVPRTVRRVPRSLVVASALRRPTRPDPQDLNMAGQAVALVEVGTRRVVEEAHTATLNRLVVETEREESASRGLHPEAVPADATALAQNTRSLFQ